MKKLILIFILTAGIFVGARAQQIPLFSQYYVDPFLYNPAMAGYGRANVTLIDRDQWTGIPGAPTTAALSIDGPVNANKIGLGLSVIDDETSIFSTVSVYGAYAYNIHFGERNDLRLGLSAGFQDQRIDYSAISVQDQGDKALLTQSQSRATFDGTFGAAYIYKDLQIGVAIPDLLAPKLDYMQNSNAQVYYSMVRNFIGSINYTFHLGDDWKLQPLAFTQYTPNAPVLLSLGANLKYKDFIWVGAMWDKDWAISYSAGIEINKRLMVGYDYDMMTTSIKTYAGTTQELMVRYIFGGGGSSNEEETLEKLRKINEKLEYSNRQHKVTEDSLRNSINDLNKRTDENKESIDKIQHNFDDFKRDMLDSLGRFRSSSSRRHSEDIPSGVTPNNTRGDNNEFPSYVLNNIDFGEGNAKLTASSSDQLNELAAILVRNPNMKIEIAGYCDYIGNDADNITLSKHRAESVKHYLVSHGAKSGQVETKGYGKAFPIADNKTPEGMAKNRRVEMKILNR